MNRPSPIFAFTVGALAGVALAGCGRHNMATPVAFTATITSVSPPAWSFSPASVVDQYGNLNFTGKPGAKDVTITLHGPAGLAAPTFATPDTAALTGYIPDPHSPACSQPKSSSTVDSNEFQFKIIGFNSDRTSMTFRYMHNGVDPHGNSMACNFYGLGAMVGTTPVPLDPIVHN